MRYALFQVDHAWRLLSASERDEHKRELAKVYDDAEGVTTYSTVGLREDADFMTWQIAEGTSGLQGFQAAVNATGLGRYLRCTHSYFASTRKSEYLRGHTHANQESVDRPVGPKGGTYLFVYPMDKKREWYRLPHEQRGKIMGEHFKIGHKFPDVHIHTGYSFGIDDQEFVVAFEGESVEEFLELVMDLRASESSAYTERDVPIFTGVRTSMSEILRQIDG